MCVILYISRECKIIRGDISEWMKARASMDSVLRRLCLISMRARCHIFNPYTTHNIEKKHRKGWKKKKDMLVERII